MLLRPAYLSQKLDRPLPTKDGGTYMLDIERVDAISDEMRAVVEELWPRAGAQAAAEGTG
jgi:hypothetical protein